MSFLVFLSFLSMSRCLSVGLFLSLRVCLCLFLFPSHICLRLVSQYSVCLLLKCLLVKLSLSQSVCPCFLSSLSRFSISLSISLYLSISPSLSAPIYISLYRFTSFCIPCPFTPISLSEAVKMKPFCLCPPLRVSGSLPLSLSLYLPLL